MGAAEARGGGVKWIRKNGDAIIRWVLTVLCATTIGGFLGSVGSYTEGGEVTLADALNAILMVGLFVLAGWEWGVRHGKRQERREIARRLGEDGPFYRWVQTQAIDRRNREYGGSAYLSTVSDILAFLERDPEEARRREEENPTRSLDALIALTPQAVDAAEIAVRRANDHWEENRPTFASPEASRAYLAAHHRHLVEVAVKAALPHLRVEP